MQVRYNQYLSTASYRHLSPSNCCITCSRNLIIMGILHCSSSNHHQQDPIHSSTLSNSPSSCLFPPFPPNAAPELKYCRAMET